ncbi:NAD(P)-dependent glycerol-3-phosphate dehydrogenase [Hyphomicrobiales bacterium]|nr:NAD(P)-dependent glycerol-3-phosphate dehydrogenase [Hyphomicrobiales bacterium]
MEVTLGNSIHYNNISVMGAGAWGTAIAIALSKDNKKINIWAKEKEVVDTINISNKNDLFLPGISLPSTIVAYNNFEFLQNTNLLFLVTPAQYLRSTLENIRGLIDNKIPIVLCSKGVEIGSLKLMSEVADEYLPTNPIAILSGPSFAKDVAINLPTALTLACKDKSVGKKIAETISSPQFRIYQSPDIVGAQIGGATKNIIAIASGIVFGKELGDSARSALITRGFSEISRLAEALGGEAKTLTGLSGMGDLILTCNSETSRNFTLGMKLGKGMNINEATNGLTSVAEGMFSTRAVIELAKNYNVAMPITDSINKLINNESDIDTIIEELLSRPLKEEA